MLEGEINGGIFWDIENCRVPANVSFEEVAGNIQKAVRSHHRFRGAITSFSAYGDFCVCPRRLRESCQRTGVKLVDIPNGRKDAADKAILVDMFLFGMDNRPPCFIVLISDDEDFSYALHILGQRGFTIMVVRSGGGGDSSALMNAGHYVLDWHTVASGGNFVIPKGTVSFGDANRPDIQNKDKMVVSEANVQPENPSSQVVNDVHCNNSSSSELELYGTSQASIEKKSTSVAKRCFIPSISAPERIGTKHVRPRRRKELYRQIKWLIDDLGGCLPLVLLRTKYQKKYGVPLQPKIYGYGSATVEQLVHKMADKFILKGRGKGKFLCVRNSPNISKGSIPIEENKNKERAHAKEVDINRFSNLGSCSCEELPVQVKNQDPQLYAHAKEADINRFSNLGSCSFKELPVQLKNQDPQLYALLMEAKSEEPKSGALLKEARIKDSELGEPDYCT